MLVLMLIVLRNYIKKYFDKYLDTVLYIHQNKFISKVKKYLQYIQIDTAENGMF